MSTITISAPRRLIVSDNGTAGTKPQQQFSEINKLLIANTTLAVWLIFLSVGGGILALYYARIGYLPDIEWKAVLIYLFIGSVVGGAIGLLLTISVFLPGVLWSEFIIFDPDIENHFSYDVKSREPCMRSIIVTLGLPFLLLLLLSHAFLLFGRALHFWVAAAGLLLLTFWLMRLLFEFILSRRSARERGLIEILKLFWPFRKSDARQTFKYSFWFTLSVLLSQIAMYIIYRLSGSLPWSLRFMALTALCTAGVWLSNHVVAFCYHHSPKQAVVAALVVAGLLLFTADSFSSLSVRLMSHYGIGGDQKFNVLLTDHGRDVAKGMNVQICGTNALCGVEVLSKVGDQYFLRVDRIYITMPKSDVVCMTH